MQLIRVAAATLNQTPFDWAGNKRRIQELLGAARDRRVVVLCLPEMCITGYGCEDAFYSRDLVHRAFRMLGELLPETRGMIVSFGLPCLFRKALFNAACLVVDGNVAGIVAKRYLAGDGIHYEPRWFKPWPEGLRAELEIGGEKIPIGDILFECGGISIGFEICEDAWVAARPGAALSRQGADILMNPSASHFAFGKMAVRERFVTEGSRAFGVSYLYANLLGNESGRAIYDGGELIASGGKLLARGPRFSFKDWHLTTAVLDVDATRMAQARTSSFWPDLSEAPGEIIRMPFDFPELDPEETSPAAAPWEQGEDVKEEEFCRAVSLALYDYLRKSRSAGFVISLSGGADSSAAACLVHLMVQLGTRELGVSDFLKKLGRSPRETLPTEGEIMRSLLACVYQRTANSSETTRAAAAAVAEAIGSDYFDFGIEELVRSYVAMVEGAIGRSLTWEKDDVALQNIQARVRAPGVWMLANLRKALLLSTSNRSETAVGYATMDGDTCGGLSPIAGIDKAFLRKWLRWLETRGPEGLAPIPELSKVNQQEPTAELRPPGAHQTDEEDLMPYPVLDAIERLAILHKEAPLGVFRQLTARFHEYEKEQLAIWVERFFRLFCRNQWKRERYAPSFHLDDENLDPKTWCRFPILSGNYEAELSELRAYVALLEKAGP